MEEQKSIDYIIERCNNLNGGNLLSQKLQLLDILLLIQRAVKEFKAKIELLQIHPLMNLLSKHQYEACKQKIEEFGVHFKVPQASGVSSTEYDTHVIDYLFPGERLDINRENADKVRLIINTLESDVFDSTNLWEEGIRNGLHDLAECLKEMVKLADKQWTDKEYELLANELIKKFSSPFSKLTIQANDLFNKWKQESYNDPEEYQALIAAQLKRLLDSDFIVIDEDHLIKSYKKQLGVLYIYIDTAECKEEHCKKFYFLSKLIGHKDGQFSFCKNSALGKYIFMHREILRTDDIEAFFFFRRICMLANEDMCKPANDKTSSDNNLKPGTLQNIEEENTNMDESVIPHDCKEAVDKVLISQFTTKDGTVLNTRKQITNTAMKLKITSNVQVAMLMKIGLELKAVCPGTNCPDFVRALIGLGVITYSDHQAITKMAGGMSKKINGHKSKGKTYPPLPDHHQLWNSSDQKVGKSIYESMISQDE